MRMEESEAYWSGLIVGIIMLVSGFSLLFIPTYTGYGAVILSLGIMTMIVVLMTKALITQMEKWMDYNARIEETVSNILTLKTRRTPTQPQTAARSGKAKVREEEIEVPAS